MVEINDVVVVIICIIFGLFGAYGMVDTALRVTDHLVHVGLNKPRTVVNVGGNTFATYSAIRRVTAK